MKQLLPLLLLSSVFITKASPQKTTATGSRMMANSVGQVVYRMAEQAQTSYVRSIPVSELQNGVYYVVLKGETDKITKTILIQK